MQEPQILSIFEELFVHNLLRKLPIPKERVIPNGDSLSCAEGSTCPPVGITRYGVVRREFVKNLLARKQAPKGWQYVPVHAIAHHPETASG